MTYFKMEYRDNESEHEETSRGEAFLDGIYKSFPVIIVFMMGVIAFILAQYLFC